MKLENFIILSNGMLINLRYLMLITPDHTGIRMNDDTWYSITEKDYGTILDNINVANEYDDN
jgi:hypothetical protein